MPNFLSMGSVFGEDIILATVTDVPQQRAFQVVSMTYLDCHSLGGLKLRQILTTGEYGVLSTESEY